MPRPVSPSDAEADGTISGYIPFLDSSFSLSDLEAGSERCKSVPIDWVVFSFEPPTSRIARLFAR